MAREKPGRTREADRRVYLNVEISSSLRTELRRRALDEGLPLKDWLSRFLRRHLGPDAARS